MYRNFICNFTFWKGGIGVSTWLKDQGSSATTRFFKFVGTLLSSFVVQHFIINYKPVQNWNIITHGFRLLNTVPLYEALCLDTVGIGQN